MRISTIRKGLLAGLASVALVVGYSTIQPLWAQDHDGGTQGGGHTTEGHTDGDHEDKGAKGQRGMSGGERGGGAGTSLRDVFHDMEDEAAADRGRRGAGGLGQGGSGGGSDQAEKGKRGGQSDVRESEGEEEDSDKPAWAGTKGPESKPGRPNLEPGVKKGTIYGDMYVVVRDDNGVPELDDDGFVKVYYLDADGNLTCCIPRDAEGNLLTTLEDGTPVLPIEVELGRLSVGRSPTRVLSAQYDEVLRSIADATSVTLDSAGRLLLTLPDGTTKTIDSPLENLALYLELLNTGTLSGIDPATLGDLAFLVDGTLTPEDLEVAASFFAAASDKTITVTVDSIEYMNTILGVDGTLADGYFDYSTFTYDRESSYSGQLVTVLVQQSDGTWAEQEVDLYEAVFGSTPTGSLTNVDAFTQATDDARAIIDFLHTYEVPEAE
ncbi:MAG: hypothetical protein K8H74_03045 [Notoacmeibacter sp.]|nr:hypothetical protein [Notoacmeibacter sp.]